MKLAKPNSKLAQRQIPAEGLTARKDKILHQHKGTC